jgi:hypothetical protein
MLQLRCDYTGIVVWLLLQATTAELSDDNVQTTLGVRWNSKTIAIANDYCTTSRQQGLDYIATVLNLQYSCDWDRLLYNFQTTI